jgi:serine/threonine protein kinase
MSGLVSCPELERLKEFQRGELSPAEALRLENHLLDCGRCAETLDSLAAEDTLAELVRAQAGGPPEAAPPAVEVLIQRLSTLAFDGEAPRTGDTRAADTEAPGRGEEIPLDFLTPPQAPDELGWLGSYRVLRVLGRGGMGLLLQAEDPRLKRQVALKVMLPALAQGKAARERFLREARAAAAIEHDHIVPIYQVGTVGKMPFLVMPLLRGQTLEAWLKEQQARGAEALAVSEVLRIGREIATGLAAAHERGLIHRDIKPSNLWLDGSARDRVKILDFGLARTVDEQPLTRFGEVVGTPSYMAPEQAAGSAVDARADLFSLGCVLYRLCTGVLPFRGKDVLAMLSALATQPPAPPREINPGLPAALSDLILELLAREPQGRPASAHAVAQRLEEIERELKTVPNLVTKPTEPEAPAKKVSLPRADLAGASLSSRTAAKQRRWWPWGVAAGLLLLAGGALAVYQLQFATADGTFVVQIDDPNVEARFKNGALQIFAADGKLLHTLKPSERNKKLPPGKYLIQVTGADGLDLDTEEFTLKKGGEVIVHVVLQPPAPKKNPVAKPPAPVAAKDPNREAAEFGLSLGGMVWIYHNNQLKQLSLAGGVPKEEFKVTVLKLYFTPASDEDLARFNGFKDLTHLWAFSAGKKVSDAGLVHLTDSTQFTYLNLGGPKVSDAGLVHLKKLSLLSWLWLDDTQVTEAGLEVLLPCLPHLKEIHLDGARVSAKGHAAIKAKYPQLKCYWSEPNHTAASAVLAAGGTVHVRPKGQAATQLVKGQAALPKEYFHLTGASLAGVQKALPPLLAKLVRLTDPKFDDLKSLDLSDTAIGDGDLVALADVSSLLQVKLEKTKVTAAAVQKLHETLPKCQVMSDHGTFGPKKAGEEK